jgi:hypothetical protein
MKWPIIMAIVGALLGTALVGYASTTTLNGLIYTWPSSHTAKALANNAAGTLTWSGDVDTGVPAGLIGFYASGSCPSGWTRYSAADGRYIVVNTVNIGSTVGTALSSLENRPAGQHDHPSSTLTADISDSTHTHTLNDPNHSHSSIIGEPDGSTATGSGGAWDYSYSTNSATTGVTINNADAGISASANLSITGVSGGVAGTNAPYIQLTVCKKN